MVASHEVLGESLLHDDVANRKYIHDVKHFTLLARLAQAISLKHCHLG